MLTKPPLTQSWTQLNTEVRNELQKLGVLTEAGLVITQGVRCYSSLSEALYDVVIGSTFFYSHKNHGFLIEGNHFFKDWLKFSFYQMSFQLEPLDWKILDLEKNLTDKIKIETQFLLMAQDHPITGQRFVLSKEFEQVLIKKKILQFSVSFSNADFLNFDEAVQMNPYRVHIQVLNDQHVIALIGEKFKAPSLWVQHKTHSSAEMIKTLQSIFSTDSRLKAKEDPSLVSNFSQKLKAPIQSLPLGIDFIQDRCLIYSEQWQGEKVKQQILVRFPALQSKNVMTTNLCDWHTETSQFWDWWTSSQLNPAILSSLLILDKEALSLEGLPEFINQL